MMTTAVVVLATAQALATPGDLDSTFGTGGKVTTNFTSAEDTGYAVAVQADGKIVVVGTAARKFAVARYNANGTLDSTFSGDGRVTTSFGRFGAAAYAVAVQSDGKIVAAGGASDRFALVRYRPNGRLDTAFGRGGKVRTDLTTGFDGAFGVAIQGDGKIVAAGGAGGSSLAPATFAVVRYGRNGRLDRTFSRDGKARSDFTRYSDVAYGVAVQGDRKIVVAGGGGRGGIGRFELARYRPNGRLDRAFSGDGKVRTRITSGGDTAFAVASQADGKIMAAGLGDFADAQNFALARYNANGSLDRTFSGNGKVTTDFGGGDWAYAVAVQPDGKIVAAGMAFNWDSWALARYTPGGSLDTTFGVEGMVTTDFSSASTSDGAYGVAVQRDGKIVVGGSAGGAGGRFAVARYVRG